MRAAAQDLAAPHAAAGLWSEEHRHRAVGADDEPAHGRERHELCLEVDAFELLPGTNRHLPSVARVDHTWIVGGRVADGIGLVRRAAEETTPAAPVSCHGEGLHASTGPLRAARRRRADVVVARSKTEHPILPAVVGHSAARGDQLTLAADVLISLDRDDRANERFAVLVEHAAGDHGASRQAQIEIPDRSSVGELHRCSRLERPPLTVGRVDEAVLEGGDGVGPGRKAGDLKSSLIVGARRSRLASTCRSGDAGALDGPSGVRGQHPSGERSSTRRSLRCVPCRRLTLPACLALRLLLAAPRRPSRPARASTSEGSVGEPCPIPLHQRRSRGRPMPGRGVTACCSDDPRAPAVYISVFNALVTAISPRPVASDCASSLSTWLRTTPVNVTRPFSTMM